MGPVDQLQYVTGQIFHSQTNMKDCLQTYTAIDRRIEALKRNRENKQEQSDKDDDSQDSKPPAEDSEDCTEKPEEEQSANPETKD